MRHVLSIVGVTLGVLLLVSPSVCAGASASVSVCDRLIARQVRSAASSTDAQLTMQDLTDRALWGVGGATTGGAAYDEKLNAIFNGTVDFRSSSNGSVPQPYAAMGSAPDYAPAVPAPTQSPSALLRDKFVRWFGSSAALNCTSSGYPAYNPTAVGFGTFNLYQIHANMDINATMFNAFNAHVIAAVQSFPAISGNANDTLAKAQDVATVTALLNSFLRSGSSTPSPAAAQANMICTYSDCDCAPGLEGELCVEPQSSSSSSSSSSTADGDISSSSTADFSSSSSGVTGEDSSSTGTGGSSSGGGNDCDGRACSAWRTVGGASPLFATLAALLGALQLW
jgi:uncharacterized membrane protein YgcG